MPEKAIATVVVRPNSMETRELDIPDIGEDDALLRVEAAGVCGTDYEWFRGDLTGFPPLRRVIWPHRKKQMMNLHYCEE
jgi:threonine dehydrogenase-like Zn-dependent dehydrogenase